MTTQSQTQSRDPATDRSRANPGGGFLPRAWAELLRVPGESEAETALLRGISLALSKAAAGDVEPFLRTVMLHQRQLAHQVGEAALVRADLAERLESLTHEPRPIARLMRVDDARRATVALSPGTVIEVGIDADLDADLLAPGNDVALTSARSAVLSNHGAPDSIGGGTRVFVFQRWWGPATSSGRPARVSSDAGISVANVPPPMISDVEALADDVTRRVQLLVDRFDQVVAIDSDEAVDPMLLAKPFIIPLAPVAPHLIRGLARNRSQIEMAVERVLSTGAFVVAQGPPGTGKSLLAGLARHLLAAGGREVIVLGLDPNREDMFYRQEETRVTELCTAAQQLARAGKTVLIFLDELDRLFHSSRTYGQSVHENAVRATILEQIGTRMDLRGILIYGTTNKAATLPSELLNRASFILTFDPLGPGDARGVLDVHLGCQFSAGTEREEVLDVVIDFVYDATEAAIVAEGTLRDRSKVAIRWRDLRQVSGRLFKDLAARFDQRCAARSNGVRAMLTADEALHVTREKLGEIVAGIDITPENFAERTFIPTAPHNPVVEVRLAPPSGRSGAAKWFRYTPVEVVDDGS